MITPNVMIYHWIVFDICVQIRLLMQIHSLSCFVSIEGKSICVVKLFWFPAYENCINQSLFVQRLLRSNPVVLLACNRVRNIYFEVSYAWWVGICMVGNWIENAPLKNGLLLLSSGLGTIHKVQPQSHGWLRVLTHKDLGHLWFCYIRKTQKSWDTYFECSLWI